MSQMNVQIVTPDGLVYDHHAAFVSVKTIDGELGILPHHINTIAVLAVDQVKVRRVDDDKHIDQHSVDMERRAKIALQRAINRINVGNRL